MEKRRRREGGRVSEGERVFVWLSMQQAERTWGKGEPERELERRACTANSAHERLEQREQLSSIVSQQISNVPRFASRCVSRKES